MKPRFKLYHPDITNHIYMSRGNLYFELNDLAFYVGVDKLTCVEDDVQNIQQS